LLLLIFYYPVIFGGKSFFSADKLASLSVKPFIDDALASWTYPLWNPFIFSGMPSFASLQSAPFVDLLEAPIRLIFWGLNAMMPLPDFVLEVFLMLFNFFLFGFFTYNLLMKRTGLGWVAVFAAVAMVFQPQVVAFAAFGHNTKLTTVALLPAIFFLLDDLLQKRQLQSFALLALAVGLQLLRAHTQMTYYTFMMIGLYFIFWLVESIRKKESGALIGKSLAMAFAALAIGVTMSAWLYLPVQEYSHYSIRGGDTGLDYGYATNWSFSPLEMLTFFVPAFVGFGGETYWGTMPFTDSPFYMGIVPLFLAGLALVIKRDRHVIFFAVLAALALLVSFGKNFSILYDPLFNFLPFFNKFRVPSMILILTAFAMVALAAIGLHALHELRRQNQRPDANAAEGNSIKKYTFIFVGFAAIVAVFFLFGKGLYLGWIASSQKPLSSVAAQAAYEAAALDAFKMLLILAASGFLVLQYLKNKIAGNRLVGGFIALLVIDLWFVDFKISNPHPRSDRRAYFAETPAVTFLKSESAKEPFRIFPAYDDKPENWYMYHKIQNIRGYHAAKLKIYQDFIAESGFDTRNRYGFPPLLEKYLQVEVSGGQPSIRMVEADQLSPLRLQADNAVMDMLNVKYLVSYYRVPDPRYKMVVEGRPLVLENSAALGRAFFVDSVRVLEGKDAFFSYLKSGQFNPAKEAVLEEEPPFAIEGAEENTVKITSFDIHEIQMEAHVGKPALLVLSEIFYPAGWKALVNGEETKIYKTNYILRSIFLQPGDHQIRFVYDSGTFKLGRLATFGIFFALIGALIIDSKIRRQKGEGNRETVSA
jgi:hypothetical protein